MIARGGEISIAGGVGEMVCDYLLVAFCLCFFFVIMCSLFLGTKSLMQREL